MKRNLICMALLLCLLAVGAIPAAGEATEILSVSDCFTERDLSGEWDSDKAVNICLTGETAECDGAGAQIDGGVVTITQKGVYVLAGSLDDGSVIVNVDSEDKVQLILDAVQISASDTAAIQVENADKVFITLPEGTQSALSSTGFDEESDVDAVIFSRDDLVFNGTGTLSVTSPQGHGIVGKDDVKFASGSYVIEASGRGIDANDSVRIASGSFSITAGKDGIRAKHEEDSEKGYVVIWDGDFDITTGGGMQAAPERSQGRMGFGMPAASASEGDSSSTKGIKASGKMTILGGSYDIDSADDALHTDADMILSGGEIRLSSGDDGMHANGAMTIRGGTIDILTSYEGIEGTSIAISGGDISVNASDDGLNAAGGNDGSGFGRYDMFASQEGVSIEISGGMLHVNASGDGIDSNGDLIVSGGDIVVSGPTNSGNGALDYNGNGIITGGTLIAAGASGMAENFSSGSTQVAAMVSLSGGAGEIRVMDAQGTVLLEGSVEKSYDCVIISSPDLAVGQSYTVSGDRGESTVTITDTVTGGGMGMGGMRGRGEMNGGMGGMRGRQGQEQRDNEAGQSDEAAREGQRPGGRFDGNRQQGFESPQGFDGQKPPFGDGWGMPGQNGTDEQSGAGN